MRKNQSSLWGGPGETFLPDGGLGQCPERASTHESLTRPRHTWEKGFTLIEMSLVFVIIALLLGQVLRGDRVVDEGRIHRMALDVAAVAGAVHAYGELYHFLPGDDPQARERWPEVVDGNGDGLLGHGEEGAFWRHLNRAGLYIPVFSSLGDPIHSLGGRVFMDHERVGFPGLLLCMNGVSPSLSVGYDVRYDDGIGETGRVRHFGNGQGVAVSYPLEGEGGVVCTLL